MCWRQGEGHAVDPAAARKLERQPLTYAQVGESVAGRPPGYRHITRTRRLTTDFDDAAHALMTWQVQARSGLRIATSSLEIHQDTVVVMRLGPIRIPCRDVRIVAEPDRRGFAYGTLPGHPERGEEAFVLHRDGDGRAIFTITAFSRPASRLARLGGPVSTGVQTLMTRRYLRSLD